jgi:hypothetical protein
LRKSLSKSVVFENGIIIRRCSVRRQGKWTYLSLL